MVDLSLIERTFQKASLTRGDRLSERGAVEHLRRAGHGGIVATVLDGAYRRRVYLEVQAASLSVSCTCGQRCCAHVWATLLSAAARELLPDGPSALPPPPRAKPEPDWRLRLAAACGDEVQDEPWPTGREIVYIVDTEATLDGPGLALDVAMRDPKRNGEWTLPRPRPLSHDDIPRLPDPLDRRILGLLFGPLDPVYGHRAYGRYGSRTDAPRTFWLSAEQQHVLVPMLCATGRTRLRSVDSAANTLSLLVWEGETPWRLCLEVGVAKGRGYEVQASLRRGAERRAISKPTLLAESGLVFWEQEVGRVDYGGGFGWLRVLLAGERVFVPKADGAAFVGALLAHTLVPALDLPEELRFEELRLAPRPAVKIQPPDVAAGYPRDARLRVHLAFEYDDARILATDTLRGVHQPAQRRFLLRDTEAERRAAERLRALGFRPPPRHTGGDHQLELASRHLSAAVRTLVTEGWKVEAEGQLYRPASAFRIKVTSGVDWFDLAGGATFNGIEVPLPTLLRAIERGEKAIRLGDGTFGVLPEEWLQRYGLAASFGHEVNGAVRFTRAQAVLLDVLLAERAQEVDVDDAFQQARERLRAFESVQPAREPRGFAGELRPYQREGLGWLHFLREFGFGGCLADDMGLGKTVQVLALLAARADDRQRERRPSLVVAPRSVIFNWKDEAARFAPQLKLLDHTGAERPRDGDSLASWDLVLTTYGTLRRDIQLLKDVRFDYAVLDESQAIKNADTDSAKATRLLQADHRLALSGTPIENHIGELWSLFAFLNPGLLGRSGAFEKQLGADNPESRSLLARTLRPFILRRTKEQVVRDLPEKTEQTVYCDLEGEQRRLYDELRVHYRAALLPRVEREGLGKSKLLILEALLRLRQAACHPGLIDPSRAGDGSAKLEALFAMLDEVHEEGHKALVFSQFVSLLTLVRRRLDAQGVTYEYLDGQTRDREARVKRFQGDPDCGLFLVSLKAGGLGLNLTAADYVFLLDPWWNPAVEAQAVDRAHRIGQTRRVFAYRLIARDTVEEKVLALQQGKRQLADAILGEDASVLRTIRREDLELLLG